MKIKNPILLALGTIAIFGLSSCDKHDHDHDHEHADGKHHHDDGDGDHPEHVGKAGPNGGRVLHDFEPHAEFFVLDDRRVQLTFVDDDYKPVPAEAQTASIVAGDRSDPTELAFTKEGTVLVSDKSLPDSDNFPLVLQIRSTPDSEEIIARFQVDMTQCPTCDYLEYACICDH